MTGHEYLQQVLDNQRLTDLQEYYLRSVRDDLETHLRQVFGRAPRFYYGGSFGKRTMIRAAYDLDLVMYFPSTHKASLAQIFDSVHDALANGGYLVDRKTVSLRLPSNDGFHVDVVPGKAQDSTFKYATLFKNSLPPSTLQTSLKVHIDSARRVRDIIRLMKLWRACQGLQLKTFALELLVRKALMGRRVDNLERSMQRVLEFIRDKILTVRLTDPANTNNIVKLDGAVQFALGAKANRSCNAHYWSEVVW